MMKQFEVRIFINGTFPKELLPQLIKDIRVETNTELDKEELCMFVLNVEADDPPEAFQLGFKKAQEFLSFYSVTTLNHINILQDKTHQITTIELTGDRKPENFEPGYDVDSPDENFIKLFMPLYPIISKKGNEYLKVAMEFLYLCRFEDLTHIVIVQCMVALEALFSVSGESSEISYKLSNRIATLLGNNTEERKKFRKEFRDFYNIRSRVIHGDFIELGAYDFGLLVARTKQSILLFLGLAKTLSHKEIIEKIDDAMIDNSLQSDLKKEASEILTKIEAEQDKLLEKFWAKKSE